MMIRVEKPTLRRKEMESVLQTMAEETIGVGQHTKLFEQKFQEQLNLEGKTVALRNYADAIRYALLSLDLKPNATIAISALSPKIYAEIIQKSNFKTLIVDIDEENGNFSYDQFVNIHNGKADAILMYEPYGNLPSLSDWSLLAIPIIEDIRETIGCSYDTLVAGQIGDIVIAAFEESDIVSTAGGSIVHTKSEKHSANLTNLLENHKKYSALGDLNAALGSTQLDSLKQNLLLRNSIFERYRKSLMRTKHSLFGINDIDYITNGHSFVVVMESKPAEGEKFALKHEVATQRAFLNSVIGEEQLYYDLYPNAYGVLSRAVRFPLYPFLKKQEKEQIEKVIAYLP